MLNHLHGLRCQPSCSEKFSDLTDNCCTYLNLDVRKSEDAFRPTHVILNVLKVLTFSTSPYRKGFLFFVEKKLDQGLN